MALGDTGMPTSFSGRASMPRYTDAIIRKPLSREKCIREAALLCFSESYRHPFVHSLTAKECKPFLRWLDASGLALYFLDRMTQTGRQSSLPSSLASRLERSLEENLQRTQGLLDESVRLQRDFQSVGLTHAMIKGASLYPISVPRPELRHQFDLDFLVTESDAPAARQILERHGYKLFAISGKIWEFKKGQTPYVAAKDLYRDLPYRGVELHLDTDFPRMSSRLQRTVFREIHGATMRVLSPVDLFLGQAFHASKDIAGPFLRGSHLLEFYRHVQARRNDTHFWPELREHACEDQRARLAIGVATYLITLVWGDFAPQALTSWTMEQLPPPIRLWLDLYGRSAIFQVPPGNKLYLRLRQEIERAIGEPEKSSKLSFGFPRAVIQATPGESLRTRCARHCLEVRCLAARSRFHVVEGVRLALETPRWRRLRSSIS